MKDGVLNASPWKLASRFRLKLWMISFKTRIACRCRWFLAYSGRRFHGKDPTSGNFQQRKWRCNPTHRSGKTAGLSHYKSGHLWTSLAARRGRGKRCWDRQPKVRILAFCREQM